MILSCDKVCILWGRRITKQYLRVCNLKTILATKNMTFVEIVTEQKESKTEKCKLKYFWYGHFKVYLAQSLSIDVHIWYSVCYSTKISESGQSNFFRRSVTRSINWVNRHEKFSSSLLTWPAIQVVKGSTLISHTWVCRNSHKKNWVSLCL